jgi:hypothetical protein
MPHSFLHIGFNFASAPTSPPTATLEYWVQAIGDDWVRYASNNYITWTNRTPQQVAETLRNAMGPTDLLFVVRINTADSSGYLPQWIWDWINQPRPPGWKAPPPLPRLPPQLPQLDPLAGITPRGLFGPTALDQALRKKP